MPTVFNPAQYRQAPRFAPADRLKAILNQPGRIVRVLDERRVEVTTQDQAADMEFQRHLPHAAAICGRDIQMVQESTCYYVLTLGEVVK